MINRIKDVFKRENVASVHTYEAIQSNASELKYQDALVRGTYHDFFDNYSRKEVTLNDAVGQRVTMGFLVHALQKLPKFVPNDEIQSEYIMDDVRQALHILNIKPKFIIIGTNAVVNGWCLIHWDPEFEGEQLKGLTCKIFGYEECHPRYWHRSHHPRLKNKIVKYDAIYIPRPAGMEAIDQTLAEERHFLYPIDPQFQHLTRIDYNLGYGYSRLQPIWDAITKLREVSNDEHFLKSLFMEVRYPQSWEATKKAQDYVSKARKATRRRGLATEAVTNPQTNEDTGLPSVQFRPWGQGPTGQKVDVNQASAYLDGEWLRLLVNLGYSQVWATGSQAGAVEGSEINLTRDDRADIAEFAILEPIFKKILEKLTQLGIMKALGVSEESQQLLLTKKYRMQCWLTWEYNDKAALEQAQLDHEMEMKRGSEDNRNQYDNTRNNAEDRVRRYNTWVQTQFIEAYRNNMNFPKTPVMSSWIKSIASDEEYVYMETHQGYSYKKPKTNPEQTYLDWADSDSKGGFFWDYLADRAPAWERSAFPSQLDTGYGEGAFDAGAEREFKMFGDEGTGTIGVGTTREAFPSGGTGQGPQTPYQMPSTMYNPTAEDQMIVPSNLTGEIPQVTTSEPSILTPGYVADPSSITGSKKVGPGRKRSPGKSATRTTIVPYNATAYNSAVMLDTFETEIPRILRLGKEIDWNMSKNTAYAILKLVNKLNSHRWRCNSIAVGNEMAFDMPLYYENPNGGVDVEYACPEAFKAVKNHSGELWLYKNLGHDGSRHTVGTYERLGWDDENNKPILKLNYDETKITELLTKWDKTDSNLYYRLTNNLPPEISTEYYCKPVEKDGKIIQTNIHNAKMQPIYEGIAIVDYGNCGSGHCDFTIVEEKKENLFGSKILGMTRDKCPRCGDTGQKSIKEQGGKKLAVCRNCGASWDASTGKLDLGTYSH